MTTSTTVYKIFFPYTSCELVFPSLNDIKCFFFDNDTVFDLLLQQKVMIKNEIVSINSETYQIALKNRLVLPVK